MTPGKTIVMAIQVADIQNLFAFELKIYFNSTVLNATQVVRPAGHFLEPANPANQFVPTWEIKNNFNATHGRLWMSFTLLYPEAARSGTGTLAQITFSILNIGSTPISFAEVVLADGTGAEIVYNPENGFFSNIPSPPPPPPPKPAHIFVNPPDITDPILTESHNFSVAVDIVDSTDLLGFEFRLTFNPSILESTGVQEGSFLKNVGTTNSTLQIDNMGGFVYVNSTLMSLPTANGDGSLGSIDFHVLKTGATALTLVDVVLLNSTSQQVSTTIANGHFSNMALEGDVNSDGIVDLLDLNVAANVFGATPEDPRWNPAADLNSDDIINVFDLVIILMNFGSVIPEYPSYLFLLVFMFAAMVLVLAASRKKRTMKLEI